jgi:hypothetical protein
MFAPQPAPSPAPFIFELVVRIGGGDTGGVARSSLLPEGLAGPVQLELAPGGLIWPRPATKVTPPPPLGCLKPTG